MSAIFSRMLLECEKYKNELSNRIEWEGYSIVCTAKKLDEVRNAKLQYCKAIL